MPARSACPAAGSSRRTTAPPPRPCARRWRRSAWTPAKVELLGGLRPYDTITGFRIHPIVGWIEPPIELTPDPFEVAEVFEVPLSFALDPRNHRRDSYERNGELRHFYVLPYRAALHLGRHRRHPGQFRAAADGLRPWSASCSRSCCRSSRRSCCSIAYRLLVTRGQRFLAHAHGSCSPSPGWSWPAPAWRRWRSSGGQAPRGVYVPPHLENGKVVPGAMRPPAGGDG